MQALSMKPVALAAALLLLAVNVAPADEGACVDRYFSADGAARARPVPELAATLRQAKDGVAREQRSLAISYERGFLIAKCDQKAAYWYDRAAAGGDDVARRWLVRHQEFEQLRANGTCFEDQCRAAGSADGHSASFAAGAQGHYFAPVTINGVTETGMIDTGATFVAMSAETARRFGIETAGGRRGKLQTPSGEIETTTVTVRQLAVGSLALRDVPVSVGIQGQMLIGMSALKRLNIKVASGVLVLGK